MGQSLSDESLFGGVHIIAGTDVTANGHAGMRNAVEQPALFVSKFRPEMTFIFKRVDRRQLHKIERQGRCRPFAAQVVHHEAGQRPVFRHPCGFLGIALPLIAQDASDRDLQKWFHASLIGKTGAKGMSLAQRTGWHAREFTHILPAPNLHPVRQVRILQPVARHLGSKPRIGRHRRRIDETLQRRTTYGEIDQSHRYACPIRQGPAGIVGHRTHRGQGSFVRPGPVALIKTVCLQSPNHLWREWRSIKTFPGIVGIAPAQDRRHGTDALLREMRLALHGPFHITLSDAKPHIPDQQIAKYGGIAPGYHPHVSGRGICFACRHFDHPTAIGICVGRPLKS